MTGPLYCTWNWGWGIDQSSDVELLQAIVQKQQLALEAIYNYHFRAVHALALRVTADAGAAQEITQDVFLKLWKNASSFDAAKGSLKAWLLTMARHLAISYLRRKSNQFYADKLTEEEIEFLSVREIPRPLNRIEARRLVSEAMSGLSIVQREALILAYYEGMTVDEISILTKSSLGTTKARMRVAHREMKKYVSQQRPAPIHRGRRSKTVKPSQFPTELLRKKLVVAGIPESEHSVDSLVAKMPADSNAHLFQGISADMMAELLLYFIAKGLVNLPLASDEALLDLPWGSHVCQFYNRKEDLVKMLVPYFKQGLEQNDACVWLVADLAIGEAENALAAVVPNLEQYLAKGQMQIRHYTEFYTKTDGTVKDADTLRDGFAEMGSAVTAKGFRGLRASGSVSWIRNEEEMSQFMDYESKVHCAIQDSRMMAVCTYPARAAALHRSRELIHNHGKIYVKRGEWIHDKSTDAKKIEAVFASLATL